MIYITGDCHGDWTKFSTKAFPEQKEMSREDFIIVCGDFGLWHDTNSERYWLDWLAEKPFTVLFVDGNHENFDRLYSDEFDIVDFHGGKSHKIRENVFHLMRGYVFSLCDKKIFAFGGARSHDISDGILDPADYENDDMFKVIYHRYQKENKAFRVNHISWWEQEMPSKEEMDFALKTLEENNNEVDFIVSHCCPTEIQVQVGGEGYDKLTSFFSEISHKVKFAKWFFGHYHDDRQISIEFVLLYDQIIRIA